MCVRQAPHAGGEGEGRGGSHDSQPIGNLFRRPRELDGRGSVGGVADRLSPLDASFLFLESRTTAMHVGGVLTFDPPPGGELDLDAFTELIGRRLNDVPRYRQKVREVPGRLGLPVWVDDPNFDRHYHVRRAALPKPGSEEQLRELVARILSRHLDRNRPLWELYLVEGLEKGRWAAITKVHHAMVDGVAAVDIGSLLLDLTPEPRETSPGDWHPRREPSGLELAAEAVGDALRRPQAVLDNARVAAADFRAEARSALTTAGLMLAAVRNTAQGAPSSPLNAPIGAQRRYGMARTKLADYKAIRKAQGVTVNDVVLATATGALRTWMLSRGEPVTVDSTIRALVPVSVRRPGKTGGNQIASLFVALPLGEPEPLNRLKTINAAMMGHKRSGEAVGATGLIRLVGLAPPTLHSMAARLANRLSSRVFNTVVSNVPGPQVPLYALGSRARDMFPVVPLAADQTVSIGVTSFDGGVYYGLNADRDAMPDVDVLADAIPEALAELRAASG